MNKKEISEIKKQFTPERNTISRICGCYVDAEKNIKCTMKEAFYSLQEEDAFKYYDIFKQSLSGTVGRNLLNMEFPMEQEKAGGTQEFLLRLRNSRLEEDDLIQEFYQKIIENYDYGQNYYIILIHASYDVPGKTTDGMEMEDASDEVYEFVLCSICPVNLSKAGLSYNTEKNNIEHRIRDWLVEAPAKAFLFPEFNDRCTDIHSVLYYTKNTEDLQPGVIEQVLGSGTPLSAVSQKDTFDTVISDTLGEDCEYSVVRSIHETLNDMIEEAKDVPEPLVLGKPEVKRLLELSGAEPEQMDRFEETYDSTAGEKASFVASNVASLKKFDIQMPDVVIKVSPDRSDLVETRIIDGRKCLVIPLDEHVEVNGIAVKVSAGDKN